MKNYPAGKEAPEKAAEVPSPECAETLPAKKKKNIFKLPCGWLFILCCLALTAMTVYIVLKECFGIDLYYMSPLPRFKCPFHHFTGYYCPGCGGTRAVLNLLHGKILTSVMYHPFPLFALALMLNFFVRYIFAYLVPDNSKIHLKPARYRVIYAVITVVIFVGHFALRNILLFYGIDTLP